MDKCYRNECKSVHELGADDKNNKKKNSNNKEFIFLTDVVMVPVVGVEPTRTVRSPGF